MTWTRASDKLCIHHFAKRRRQECLAEAGVSSGEMFASRCIQESTEVHQAINHTSMFSRLTLTPSCPMNSCRFDAIAWPSTSMPSAVALTHPTLWQHGA